MLLARRHSLTCQHRVNQGRPTRLASTGFVLHYAFGSILRVPVCSLVLFRSLFNSLFTYMPGVEKTCHPSCTQDRVGVSVLCCVWELNKTLKKMCVRPCTFPFLFKFFVYIGARHYYDRHPSCTKTRLM